MTTKTALLGLSSFIVLVFASVSQFSAIANATTPKSEESTCHTVNTVEGEYQCSGECVIRASDGGTALAEVTGEVDVIRKIEGAKTGLYRSEISGSKGFHEVEIGALTGLTLRTATAEVSDNKFPVLEEYIFEHDPTCAATAYTKIVRNPDPQNFKACNIRCERQN